MKFWESQPANVFAAPYGQGGSHYVYRHLSPMQALGLDAADVTPRLAPTPDAQWESTTILAGRGLSRNAYIAVHASARDNGGDGAFLD
ncbi:MAG: glycosyltransferase family 9 protein, partial [Mesorhizobium sp.]